VPIAAEGNKLEVLRALLNAGAPLGPGHGGLALAKAIGSRNPEMVGLLIEHGADPEWVDKDGNTLVMLTIWVMRPEIIEILINHGADPNKPNASGETPLWRSETAYLRGGPMSQVLLSHGAIYLTPEDALDRGAGKGDRLEKGTGLI
jgi:ankyrin repeat protein